MATDFLALPAGPELDGLVDDALGVDRTASTPDTIGDCVSAAWFSNEPMGYGVSKQKFQWGSEPPVEILVLESKWNYGGAHGNCGYGLWFWEQRHGKPWQAALEKHVAAWRAQPSRQWSTDPAAMLELLEKMQKLKAKCDNPDAQGRPALTMQEVFGGMWAVYWEILVGHPADRMDYLHLANADTLPLAVCRAFLKEKESRK